MGTQSQMCLNQITDREHPWAKPLPFPCLGRKLLESCEKKDPNVMEKLSSSSMFILGQIWSFLGNSAVLEEVEVWGMQTLQDVAH